MQERFSVFQTSFILSGPSGWTFGMGFSQSFWPFTLGCLSAAGLCQSVQALPQLYCPGGGLDCFLTCPKGRSFGVFSFFLFPVPVGVYLCPAWFQDCTPMAAVADLCAWTLEGGFLVSWLLQSFPGALWEVCRKGLQTACELLLSQDFLVAPTFLPPSSSTLLQVRVS